MAVGEIRPGYELWRPNRERSESVTTKFIVVFLLVVSAALIALIALTGFPLLDGGSSMGIICFIFAIVYLAFAYFIARWSRGVLPVVGAFAVLLIIFCVVGADSWFARDKAGFDEALLPSPLIGTLLVLLIPIQVLLLVAATIGFSQEWHVEEERPIGSGEDYGAGAPPENGIASPA